MAGQIAAQEEIEWVIAGGIAMHLYGSPAKLVTENLQKEALTLI